MRDELYYKNQSGLIDPQNLAGMRFIQLGAGAIGSFFALTAAKMGVEQLRVFDHDTLETHNAANQWYPPVMVGKLKVEALMEMVKLFTGVVLDVHGRPWKATDEVSFKDADVLVLTVDNMETRIEAYTKWKEGGPRFLLDGRMGAMVYRAFLVDRERPETIRWYDCNMYSDTESMQDRCSEKSIIFTVMGVVADMLCLLRRAVVNDPDIPVEFEKDFVTGIYMMKHADGRKNLVRPRAKHMDKPAMAEV